MSSDPLSRLKEIEPMPEFQPKPIRVVGVETPKLDEKTIAIVNAFSVSEQKFAWVEKAILTVNENLFIVVEVLKENRELAKAADNRGKVIASTPTKLLWKFVHWALLAGGGLLIGYAKAKLEGKPH